LKCNRFEDVDELTDTKEKLEMFEEEILEDKEII
jgi:hypothetical protein